MWHPILEMKRAGLTEVCIYGRISWFYKNEVIHSLSGDELCFLRSLAKPVQMKTIAKELDKILSPEEKALALSSHNGEKCHTTIVSKMLKGEDQNNLVLKEISNPHSKNDKISLSKLFNTCSGKHAAILKACRINNWPVNNYHLQSHPYHQAYLKKINSYLGEKFKSLTIGVDGCQLPTLSMKLNEIAKIYSLFPSEKKKDWIWETMHSFPELIGGKDRIDSLIMSSCKGEVLAKEGAKGLLGLSILNKNFPQGLGVIIKLAHGSDSQAMNYLAKTVLEYLGYSLDLIYPTTEYTVDVSKNILPKKV